MTISAIVAMDRAGLIGDGVRMPWYLPSDLRRFRDRTMGKPLIMGRRTFQTLRAPLPGRLNIVITRNVALPHEGCRLAGSVDDALRIAVDHLAETGGDEVMIIGGAVIYEATMARWDRLLLTIVEGEFAGNIYFPLDHAKQLRWRLANREFHDVDLRNPHPHWFLDLERAPETAAPSLDFALDTWLGAHPGPRADEPRA